MGCNVTGVVIIGVLLTLIFIPKRRPITLDTRAPSCYAMTK